MTNHDAHKATWGQTAIRHAGRTRGQRRSRTQATREGKRRAETAGYAKAHEEPKQRATRREMMSRNSATAAVPKSQTTRTHTEPILQRARQLPSRKVNEPDNTTDAKKAEKAIAPPGRRLRTRRNSNPRVHATMERNREQPRPGNAGHIRYPADH